MEKAETKVYQKLAKVQSEIKVPKGQYNSFGKYKYRSCEDIIEAAKPICQSAGALILLTDESVQVGDRYYIKATARFIDAENYGEVCNSAYAREEDVKKGMDGSQITGTASSYARKYALNGLLALDDTKDADTDEHKNQTQQVAESKEVCCVCGRTVINAFAEKSKEANNGKVYCSGTCLNGEKQ